MSSLKCKTKYPIILVHGTGFRDDNRLYNYWGRIPGALSDEGAEIYYSGQDAWGSIEFNSNIVKDRIKEILLKTGKDKVNIIAHSKGGLESRYMISALGMSQYIASLTTISTPHHGSKTIDMIYKLPSFIMKFIALFVNFYYKLLGDKNPDFFTACMQFSASFMKDFNNKCPDSHGIFCQSYAARMRYPFSDIIFFLTWIVIKLMEGDNDGLVNIKSAEWGKFMGVIEGKGMRGMSHADVVDFRRIAIRGVDIRQIYMGIAGDLKKRGF